MYLLFAFDTYYPTGGAQDYKGTFPTVAAAKLALPGNGGYQPDHAHVFGVQEGRIVAAWTLSSDFDGWVDDEWTMENYGAVEDPAPPVTLTIVKD